MSSGSSSNASPGKDQSGGVDSVIDPNLTSTNPGSYEDLHKKTKGKR